MSRSTNASPSIAGTSAVAPSVRNGCRLVIMSPWLGRLDGVHDVSSLS